MRVLNVFRAVVVALALGGGAVPAQEAAPPEQETAQEDASEPERGVRIGDYVATGEVEIGWRFTGLDGSRELYRSQVDLPDGPTLAFSRMELRSPENTGPIFDALTLEGSGWGSEPNSHARARAERRGLYVADYWNRRVDSYNFAPDFASPFFEQGALVAPHGWDRTRRMQHLEVTLFPERRIEGHFGFHRVAQSGLGLGTTVGLRDVILDRALDNRTNELRGGVALRWPRWALVAEGGARSYRDDETSAANALSTTDPETLAGLRLRRTGDWDAPFGRASLTASPIDRLRLTARAIYTDYDVEGSVAQQSDDLFSDPSTLDATGRASGHAVLFDSQQTIRVLDRLRLGNYFRYRRYRTTGMSDELQVFNADPASAVTTLRGRDSRDEVVSTEPRAEVDLARGLRAWAAYRFARREAFFVTSRESLVSGAPAGEGPEVERHDDDYRVDVFLAGGSYRLRHDARLYVEYENGRDPATFFTTVQELGAGGHAPEALLRGPGDYQLLRARGSWRPRDWIDVAGSVRVTDRSWSGGIQHHLGEEEGGHEKRHGEGIPRLGAPLQTSRHRAAGISVRVTPEPRVTFGVTYDRARSTADITYRAAVETGLFEFDYPTFFTRYEGDENVVTADVMANPTGRLTIVGLYNLVSSSGTLPVHYHQAHLRAEYLLGRGVSGVLQWRLYDYDDHRVEVTDYRANHGIVGLRWVF